MGKSNVSSSVVLKSGLWYTISNFAFRAIGFITTPIFARVLSQLEYGEYNNFSSWLALMTVVVACDMHTSVIRAKLDYKEDLERYAFSVLTLSSVITLICYVIVMLNKNVIADFMGIDAKYFHIMFIYIIFVEAYYVFITFAVSYTHLCLPH